MVILADVGVEGGRLPGRVVVVPHGQDEVRAPAVDQVGHVLLGVAGQAVVADDGEAGRRQAVLQALQGGLVGGAPGGRVKAGTAGPNEPG